MSQTQSRHKIGGGPAVSRRAPLTHQPACKPGSVGRRLSPLRDGHSSATPVARRLTATYPDGRIRTSIPRFPSRHPYSVLLPVGFAVPPMLPSARCALTAPFHPCRAPSLFLPRKRGRVGWGPAVSFSVALSLGLRPPDVIRHRTSMEPGLSSRAAFRLVTRAAVRPTDALGNGGGRPRRQGRMGRWVKRSLPRCAWRRVPRSPS